MFKNGGRRKSLVRQPPCTIRGFKEVEEIGHGGFGVVFKARHELDGDIYALKRVRIRRRDKIKMLVGEVKMLTKLNHTNVVRYYNSWIEENCDYVSDEDSGEETEEEEEEEEEEGSDFEVPVSKETIKSPQSSTINPRVLFIQMEYCGTSTLRAYIDEGYCQKKSCRNKIINSTLDGLEYLHSKAIIHRDLKPENIFINNDKAKIGDFGLATKVRVRRIIQGINRHRYRRRSFVMSKENLTTNIGSLMYACPEILCDEPKSKYGQEVDIYSLGIIFFEVSYRPLSTAMERMKTLRLLRSPEVVFPEDFETEVTILEDMLDHKPQKRPTVRTIKKYFQTSSNPKTHSPSKNDFLYALINTILAKRASEMALTELESEIVISFKGLYPTHTVSRFGDVCDTRLLSILHKKPTLYTLTKSRKYVRLNDTVDHHQYSGISSSNDLSFNVPRLDLLL